MKFREYLKEVTGVTDTNSIVKKFLALDGITKKGTKYTYTWGTGNLTLDIKSKKLRGAIFETDRVHDFLEKMEKLGFGENIFHTLSKLSSSKKMNGYDTVLSFEVNEQESEDFEPHMMYDPKTGKEYEANTYEDHMRMKKLGYTHEKNFKEYSKY